MVSPFPSPEERREMQERLSRPADSGIDLSAASGPVDASTQLARRVTRASEQLGPDWREPTPQDAWRLIETLRPLGSRFPALEIGLNGSITKIGPEEEDAALLRIHSARIEGEETESGSISVVAELVADGRWILPRSKGAKEEYDNPMCISLRTCEKGLLVSAIHSDDSFAELLRAGAGKTYAALPSSLRGNIAKAIRPYVGAKTAQDAIEIGEFDLVVRQGRPEGQAFVEVLRPRRAELMLDIGLNAQGEVLCLVVGQARS